MKILLIVPPDSTEDRVPLGKFKMSTVPLGLCYIASVLESHGFSPAILDMSISNMPMKKLLNRLANIKPDVVGITSMTSNFLSAVRVAKTVKLWNPESVVVLGGGHATFVHREILATIPEVDVVVRYEGEFTMSELAHVLEKNGSLKEVKGISFMGESKQISTPFRERCENLDALPYPAYHFLEPSVKEYIGNSENRNFPVLTTRGCPFGCVFCSTMAFNGRKYRTRSIASVIGELEYLIGEFKVNDVSFVDDNFTMQKDRVFMLCEEIEKRNLSLKWGCSARVDQVSEELLKAMRDAGCTDVFFGIESASQRVLDIVRKGFSVAQAKNAVKTAEKVGIKTHCSFIIGLPGESARSLKNMIAFIKDTKPSGRVLPNLLDILPGTELFERKEKYFPKQPPISRADCTKVRLEMLTRFYKYSYGMEELFRVAPPNITFE